MKARPLSLSACLVLAPALLGVAGCDPKEGPDKAATAGFDASAPGNRPAPARFGQRQEPQLSPEARSLLERTQSATAAASSSGEPTADAGRWGTFFDGAGTNAPLDESKVGAVMAQEGVSHGIVDAVMKESRQQGADPLLVFSVIKQESGFDTRQRSSAGARGLMQIMPETGRGLGVRDPGQLYTPQVNVRAGVRYLKSLFDQFSGITMEQLATVNPFSDNGVKSAIAAYNAGPGAVSKYQGVPPFRETRNYVDKVLGYYDDFRRRASSI